MLLGPRLDDSVQPLPAVLKGGDAAINPGDAVLHHTTRKNGDVRLDARLEVRMLSPVVQRLPASADGRRDLLVALAVFGNQHRRLFALGGPLKRFHCVNLCNRRKLLGPANLSGYRLPQAFLEDEEPSRFRLLAPILSDVAVIPLPVLPRFRAC